MSDSRLALKNSAFAFLAITTQLFGTSIIFFIIARMDSISIADFGRLTYAFALAQMIALFFEYGLGPYLAKRIAAQGKDIITEQVAYGLHLALMAAGLVLFFSVVQLLELAPLNRQVCYWIGASVFVTTSLRFFYSYYQGRERHNSEFVSTLIEISIQLAVIIGVFIQQLNVLELAQLYFFGRVIAWLAAYLVFSFSEYLMLPRLNMQWWRNTLIEALPFNLTFFTAFAITSLDTIMLHKLAPGDAEHQVGLYQAAIRLVLIPTILATVATRVFLPQFSRMGGDNHDHLRHLNNILLLLGILAGTFCYFQGQGLTELAYGTDYDDAAGIVSLLALTLALRFGAAFNLYFTLRDQMWARFSFACIALVTLILANLLLVPRYGVMGTVYASIITHVVYWIPVLFLMHKQAGDALLGWRWWYGIPVACLYGALMWVLQDLGLWWNALVSVPFTALAVAWSIPHGVRQTLLHGLLRRSQ